MSKPKCKDIHRNESLLGRKSSKKSIKEMGKKREKKAINRK